MIKFGSDFSGIGAADQALLRLGILYKTIFACDMDKFARQSFIANYGEPDYYPENVYDREIPSDSLDIYVTSPPCQAFSIAGKRMGKDDKRGILFFNSHEFIKKNNPRFFMFENVKGLLSDDSGRTFGEWVAMLGGKSINGNSPFFPHEDAVPYHIYWKVINATDFNVPQNRERVFIIGIRDDQDNNFSWPSEIPLILKVADLLEENVDSKYYLSEKAIQGLLNHKDKHKEKGNGFGANIGVKNGVSATISARYYKDGSEQLIISDSGKGRKREEREILPPLRSHDGCGHDNYLVRLVNEINNSEKLIKFGNSQDQSLTPTNGVSQTLSAGHFNQPKIIQLPRGYNKGSLNELCPTITKNSWEQNNLLINSGVSKGYEVAEPGDCISIDFPDSKTRKGRVQKGKSQTIDTGSRIGYYDGVTIRRLTPRECMRLMNFPDTYKIVVSDSQAYKQAGNSIVVACLEGIIKVLKDKCNLTNTQK